MRLRRTEAPSPADPGGLFPTIPSRIPSSVRHWPTGRHQAFVAPDERSHVLVAHLLRRVAGQSTAVSPATVHHDLRRLVGIAGLDVALQDTLAQVARLHSVSGSPLALLANIQQHQSGVGLEMLAQGFDRQLLDASLSILDQMEKTGSVIHGDQILWQPRH